MLTKDERDWLRKQLHSAEMQCRQCELTLKLLDQADKIARQDEAFDELRRLEDSL